MSQSSATAWYPARIYCGTPFFPVSCHTFAKTDWSPQTVQTASRGDVSVKPQRKCFTEKAFNHLPFFFLAVTTANLTSAWMKEQQWRKMTCCAVCREMSFMGHNTANGVIISDHCVLLFPSHLLLCCDEDRCLISPCYLHMAQIILCFSFSFTFILRFHAIHDYGLCGGRVMNKLSIRGKAKSYSEVTCILLPF